MKRLLGRSRSVSSGVLQGWEGAIGNREEEGKGNKGEKVRTMEGRMVNGREEQVYIVDQAARWRHT